MSNQMQKSHQKPNTRDDGYKVHAQIEQIDNNKNAYAVKLDVNSLPVPPRRYFAESCFAKRDGFFVNICFLDEKLFSKEIKSCLQIRMPIKEVEHFLNHLLQNPEGKIKNLDETKILLQPSYPNEPEQYVKLVSNVAFAAVNEEEACIDFYHVSAFSKALLKANNSELGVDMVVRVDLSKTLLDKLVNTLFFCITNNNGE